MPHSDKEMISFFLTTKCNLQCNYCYIRRPDFIHQTLDIEFAKAGIADYLRQKRKPHFRFFGAGEPTCEFELLKTIHEYSRNLVGNTHSSEIQTNGVLEPDIAMWVRNHIDIVWVSCDGTPDIQNKYRPKKDGGESTGDLEQSVRIIAQKQHGVLGIRMTITSDNVDKQIECLKYFKSLGVNYVWADPIFPPVGERLVDNSIDTMEFAYKFIEAQKYAETIKMFYGSILTCNFDGTTKISCRTCLPVPHLTSDGYVSACDMALFGAVPSHMSVFIYGKWNKEKGEIEYDSDKIERLQSRTVDKMRHCNNCIAREHCAGYCPGEVVNETMSLFGQKKNACKAIKYIFQNSIKPIAPFEWLHP